MRREEIPPPSPKPRYRSQYRYLAPQTLDTLSPFNLALPLIDYANLERPLAAHIYVASANGQVPFHPVSMSLLPVYRRERNLSRHETLRILKSQEDHHDLYHYICHPPHLSPLPLPLLIPDPLRKPKNASACQNLVNGV